jgi:hypothetical protein
MMLLMLHNTAVRLLHTLANHALATHPAGLLCLPLFTQPACCTPSLLLHRRHKKDAADAARPVKASASSAPAISATASSELQQRLMQRQTRLESTEEEADKDQN